MNSLRRTMKLFQNYATNHRKVREKQREENQMKRMNGKTLVSLQQLIFEY